MGDAEQQAVIPVREKSLSISDVRAQVNFIQQVLREVMQKDTHYGVIQGCGDKPALLKPGAEKLCLVFQLVPTFEVVQKDLPGGHREYEFTCILKHRHTEKTIGQGVGVCTTMESKYRYRWENTGKEVPKEYWEYRDNALLGGPAYVARKAWKDNKQSWFIFQKIEHTDPADYYNTVKKIAKKRSHVDAAITATAASDIFTQDIEEDDAGHTEAPSSTPAKKPGGGGGGGGGGATISDPQRKRMYAIWKASGWSNDDAKAALKEFGFESSEDVTKARYEEICTFFESGKSE